MKAIDDLVIGRESSVLEALETIDRSTTKIVLVTDASRHLLGTVTDGDIRRGMLRGVDLSGSVVSVMNAAPHSVRIGESEAAMLAVMKQYDIHHLPILDWAGCVVGLVTDSELLQPGREGAWVVVMAGGLGSRLQPLTDTMPKPLLPIGGRPLLEIMIANLSRQGFERFFLSVNYRADMIESHFGDGSRFGVSVEYLTETERLGTAGALRMLREKAPKVPIIVINGDILTTLDARLLLMFHREQGAPATVCVCEHSWRVPYGVVVQEPDGGFKGIEEKPLRRELISAGINVFSPEALDILPPSGPFDMPELLSKIAARFGPPKLYPMREYWLDIGRHDDLTRAQNEVSALFDDISRSDRARNGE
jgi:dTDP-glucose pyrophosphorylase